MRRLQFIKFNDPIAVLLRHFFGCGVRGVLPFLLFLFSPFLFGQDVEISSDEPNPTSSNPIPIDIKFEGPVNRDLVTTDFEVTNGDIQNFSREDPDFIQEGGEKSLTQTSIDKTIQQIIGEINLDLNAIEESFENYLRDLLKDAVVSIDYNGANELFYLTLNDGIYKYNINTGAKEQVITGAQFDTPLDMVINRQNGTFYVADAEKGQILIFDSNYTQLAPIGTGSNADSENPRGATGLALDYDGNIYVADNFTGIATGQDAIKIYDPNGGLIKIVSDYEGQQIEDPFRIAVDNEKNIYVSESGGDNRDPRIIIFNKDYEPLKNIQGGDQGNPGSLIVDDYGYLYVLDYEDDFNLTDLFNDPIQVLENYETLRDGKYTVNAFDTNNDFSFVKQFNNAQLNLPIDLALDNCGLININNLELGGTGAEIGEYCIFFGAVCFDDVPLKIDADFDFTLIRFKRNDIFTAEVTPKVSGPVTVVLKESDLFKCGPQPEGDFSIEYESEDEEDLIPPVFTNCGNLTFSADPNKCGAVVNFAIPTASDEDGNVTVTLSSPLGSGDEFPVGTTTVEYEAENIAGKSTCSFTVTVTDDEDPFFIDCPPVINAQLLPGETSIRVDFNQPVGDDNCGEVTVTQTKGQASGTEFSQGTHAIEYRVTDASGRTAVCEFNVVVSPADVTPPVFANCVTQNITRGNDPDECGAVVNFAIPTASDEDGSVTVNLTSPLGSGDVFPVGTTTVAYEAENTAGKSTCSFTVTVTDDEDPFFIDCPPVINAQLLPGETSIRVDFDQPVGDDNCEEVTVTQTAGQASGTQFSEGTHAIEFRVTDASGRTTDCSFNVVVSPADANMPPGFTNCPSVKLLNSELGLCGAVPVFSTPDAEDEENDVVVVTRTDDGPALGELFPVGITTVTYEANDGVNPPVACSFDVIVEDIEDPTITCPPNVNETVPLGVTGKIVNYTEPTYGDNCSGATMVQTNGLSTGSEFPAGQTITNTFVVTDAGGKTATCSFTVTITASNDEEDPVITCPTDIEVLADPGACGAVVNYDLPTASDNAGTPTISIINGGPFSGSFFPIGTTEIEFEAKDSSNRTAICTLKITVRDEEAPVFTCPQNSQRNVTAVNGKFLVPNLLGEVQAEDNCSEGAEITYTQVPEAGDEIFANTTVLITAYDQYGNDSTVCPIQLIVDNNQDPLEITCPQDSTPPFGNNCSFTLLDYKNMATVSSPTAVVTQDPPAGTVIFGRTTVTLTAVEGNQSDDCTFIVDPVDDTKPVLSCRQDFELYLNEDGYGIIPPEMLLASVSDNCGIESVTLDQDRFETADVGLQDVLVTVIDVNGNVETCVAKINVVPYDPQKSVDCVPSLTLSLDENGYAELSLYYTGEEENIELDLSKSEFTCDDIGPPQMITASYQGEHTGSCEIEINIVDELPPVVQCNSEIDLILDENGEGELTVADVNFNSADNCEIDHMVLSRSSFTTADIGLQTVRLTVTDPSGNSDFCEVTVNVRPFMGTTGDLNCVDKVTLELDNSGNAILKAEDLYDGDPAGLQFFGETTYTCADLGTNYITFSKKDDPAQSCEIEVEVLDNLDPIAACLADFTLRLDVNGNATLSPEEFGIGSTDNCGIASMSLDRTSFTTAHLGEQTLVLTVTDTSGNVDSCDASIVILPYDEKNPSGFMCKDLFTLSLNADGTAQLQPQDLFTGGTSGTYNVSQSNFTCEDLGENEVVLSYSTTGGSGTCTIKVMVEDPLSSCGTPIEPENEFLIMYPNPGDGLLSFELSPGLEISRIEIFDFRGRFLREQSYDNSETIKDYNLDLREYQAGVYALMIYTNGREYLKRAIIR